MLIDTHAHLNFNVYKQDADEVIRRSLENDIWMINVGTKYETSKKAAELAQKYEKGVYAAVGLHPIHLETGLVKIKNDTEEIEVNTKEEDFDYEKYKDLALRSLGEGGKVVAIGEIGLDYYWRPKTTKKKEIFKQKQKELLLKQLGLAKELNLPVIFHCRMAHQDLINELRIKNYELRGVVHCFSGNWNEAKKYLEMGFYLGFNGIIFKLDLDEIIKNTPLDKILIETDCPYLTPPQRTGRNEPLYIKYVAEKIGQIKNIDLEELAKITTENAKKLFKI
jgi:TatD DNase family protein